MCPAGIVEPVEGGIVSPDRVLRIPRGELTHTVEPPSAADWTLKVAERLHILRALEDTRWVVGGPRGAATRLGLKRTTLRYKMDRLGIRRRPQWRRAVSLPNSCHRLLPSICPRCASPFREPLD